MSMPNDMRDNDMRDDERSHVRDDTHHEGGTGSWMVPLALLVALAIGGLIYAFTSGDSNLASDQRAPAASTTGSGAGTTGSGGSGAGTGMTGEQTGAATTQTPRGAATGGGGAASR